MEMQTTIKIIKLKFMFIIVLFAQILLFVQNALEECRQAR